MRPFESLSLRYDGEEVWILDQTLLPQEKKWHRGTNPDDMIGHIKTLRVRGAPLIGVAAAMCLARLAETGADEERFRLEARRLRDSRPTAVNLMVAIDRLTDFAPGHYDATAVVARAEQIAADDVALCDSIARHGETLIRNGDNILTHCNTGGLATAGVGTAIGIIRRAKDLGKKIHVYVDETRPLLQGGRLTAWEMGELGVPYTLICDSMAAILMRQGLVQKVIVGADRICRNGDFANKVGTYGLAVLAKHHKVPFYVAAPHTTLDMSLVSGGEIPIEERNAKEVRGVTGAFGNVEWAPVDAEVFNPAFDVTPAELVTGWILDTGIYTHEQFLNGGFK